MALVPFVGEASAAVTASFGFPTIAAASAVSACALGGIFEASRRGCKRRRKECDADVSESGMNSDKILEQRVSNMEKQMIRMQNELSTKPGRHEVPTTQQLVSLTSKVEVKAESEQVATLEQLSDLAAKIEAKQIALLEQVAKLEEALTVVKQQPDSDQVPSPAQIQEVHNVVKDNTAKLAELSAGITKKPNFDQVASLAQVRELQICIANMIEDNAKKMALLSEGISKKPDSQDVPKLEDFHNLSKEVNECVTPVLMQTEELMSCIRDKPSFDQVNKLLSESHVASSGWHQSAQAVSSFQVIEDSDFD